MPIELGEGDTLRLATVGLDCPLSEVFAKINFGAERSGSTS